MTGRRGRRQRKLLDDLKESRGYSHKEEALDRTMWRASLGETLDLSLDYEMKLNEIKYYIHESQNCLQSSTSIPFPVRA